MSLVILNGSSVSEFLEAQTPHYAMSGRKERRNPLHL